MNVLTQFLLEAVQSLQAALRGLLWPALVFLGLGFAVKRSQLLPDMRRAFAQGALNLQIMAFNLVLVVPVIGLAAQALWLAFDRAGLILLDPSAWARLPAWLTILVAVFVGDFVGYWRHRLEHTPLLWPSHAVHHSDTEMTWLTIERFHPINRLTTFLIDGSVLLILGLPPFAVLANSLLRHYYGAFIHADLPWTYGRLGLIFVSPAMHRWHHSAEARFFDTNYATVFSVFDRAFRTFKVPGACTSALGVTDRMAPTLLGQIGYPLTGRAYRRLFRRKPRQPASSTPDSGAPL